MSTSRMLLEDKVSQKNEVIKKIIKNVLLNYHLEFGNRLLYKHMVNSSIINYIVFPRSHPDIRRQVIIKDWRKIPTVRVVAKNKPIGSQKRNFGQFSKGTVYIFEH